MRKKIVTSVVGIALAAAPFAVAQSKKPAPKKPAAAAPAGKAKSSTSSGMVVVKDPVTGALRAPTAEEYQALTNGGTVSGGTSRTSGPQTAVKGGGAVAEAAVGTQVLHPDGTVSVRLDDSHAVFAVATRTPDGKIVLGEVTGIQAANAAVSKTGKAKTAAKGKADASNEK
ncbi:hypothetical protein F183_A08060 [Bryobacterales bacterium F-183]|nr:hypothetical protein F183_A08060 [Bryobacterales bacterium F-183]